MNFTEISEFYTILKFDNKDYFKGELGFGVSVLETSLHKKTFLSGDVFLRVSGLCLFKNIYRVSRNWKENNRD